MSGTPVLSYIQPFQEVTGSSSLIGNLEDTREAEFLINSWIGEDYSREIKIVDKRILSKMGVNVFNSKLVNYLMRQ
ncbi:MAG: hypothetical protein QXX63_01220 [Thermoplasmatales archaeon]